MATIGRSWKTGIKVGKQGGRKEGSLQKNRKGKGGGGGKRGKEEKEETSGKRSSSAHI